MHEPGLTGAHEASLLMELHVVPPMALMVLAGDLDLHTVEQLDGLLRVVDAVHVDRLTLDLHDVDFVSVGALSTIAQVSAALDARGGGITIVGARPIHGRVLDVLDAAGIELSA